MHRFRVTYTRNGQSHTQDVLAEGYKTSDSTSSKTIHLLVGEKMIGTFFDVDNIFSLGPVKQASPEIEESLDALMDINDAPKEPEPDLSGWYGVF